MTPDQAHSVSARSKAARVRSVCSAGVAWPQGEGCVFQPKFPPHSSLWPSPLRTITCRSRVKREKFSKADLGLPVVGAGVKAVRLAGSRVEEFAGAQVVQLLQE